MATAILDWLLHRSHVVMQGDGHRPSEKRHVELVRLGSAPALRERSP